MTGTPYSHISNLARTVGFETEIGGGGAAFLSDYSAPNAYVWLTCGGGGVGMPTDTDWTICTYANDADGEDPIFAAHHDDENAMSPYVAVCKACETALAHGATIPGISDWDEVDALVKAAASTPVEAADLNGPSDREIDTMNDLILYLETRLPHLFGEPAPMRIFWLKSDREEILSDVTTALKELRA